MNELTSVDRNEAGMRRDGTAPRLGRIAVEHSVASSDGWAHEADVVVVGSGAAASAAAIFAGIDGATVVMLEKAGTAGGVTAKSSGVIWIPDNYLQREMGVSETREGVLRYLARTSYPALYDPEDKRFGMPENVHQLHEAYFTEGPATLDALRSMGLKTRGWMAVDGKSPMPDYHAQMPENQGILYRAVVPELAEGETPLDGGKALLRQLRAPIDEHGTPVMLAHRVVRLVLNDEEEIVGVEAINAAGKTLAFRARKAVIFGSGGFTADADKCRDYLRGPIFGGSAVASNEGDILALATSVNAKLGNMNDAWWWSAIVEQALPTRITPNGIGQIAGDSSILVNAYGLRCVNEKSAYNERTQAHFIWDPVRGRYPNHILFMIYDQSCRERFAQAYHAGTISAPGENVPYILTAPTLAELTQVISARLAEIVDKTGNYSLSDDFLENLEATIARYNSFAEAGADKDFHRGEQPFDFAFHGGNRDNPYPNETMRPLSPTGPYYAVMLGGGTLDTKGGPQINRNGQILDVNSEPIPRLYGAGNCIASPTGHGYWSGGATIGPALTYGAIAGRHAARLAASPDPVLT